MIKKKDLIAEVAKMTGTDEKTSQKNVDAVLGTIADLLTKGEKVQIMDFGTFDMVTVAEHSARNPHTGETIIVPEKKRVKFKQSKGIEIYKVRYCH